MNCRFCGRRLRSLASIQREAGECCYRRDAQQIKLDLWGSDDQPGQAGRTRGDIQAGSVDVPVLREAGSAVHELTS